MTHFLKNMVYTSTTANDTVAHSNVLKQNRGAK